MLVYRGISALSEFRQEKLLRQLKEIDRSIKVVSAEFIHFVNTSKPLSADEDKLLSELLTYDTPITKQDVEAEMFLVTPRAGTISPWSSKATDIAKNSGLNSVQRLERGVAYFVQSTSQIDKTDITPLLHDRMTQTVLDSIDEAKILFNETPPKPLITIDALKKGKGALLRASSQLGLALADDEIEYLFKAYKQLKRNPTDVELMMFAQVNSEHCRHKIFNADWVIDGKKQPKSLFKMIKNTYEKNSDNILSAYSDNAAVLKGSVSGRFFGDSIDGIYRYHQEPIHSVIKVETHNHPTAIAPFPGAATGAGGEIRDEGATGERCQT